MNSEPPLTAEQEQLLQKLALAVEVSQGNFYLIFAHCNYIALQEQLATRLAQLCPIKTVVIQPTDTTLYTAIGQQLAQKKATAVQVLGLEGIANLGQLLAATDPVREEFRNHFHFPLVIWVNNTVQSQWIHSAPNLESWGVTKDFAVSSEFIANFLQKKAEQIFLENLTISRADAVALGREIAAARDDLAQANLAPEVEANLKALLGFTKEIHHQFDEAIVYYQEALSILQLLSSPLIRGVEGERTSFPAEGDIFSDSESFPILERLGKVLQYLTFCSYRKTVKKKNPNAIDWQETRNFLQQTLQVLERLNRPDFVANSLTFLGQILRTLEEWETLEKLAETALVFHQQQGQAIKIAEDTGFLAEVALAQGKNQQAIRLIQEAIKIYPPNVSETDTAPSRFRLIQGKAQQHLGEFSAAIQSLETAKKLSFPAGDEQLYLEILTSLQQLYFEQEQDYLKAFQLSQEIVQTKQAFGQFAFVGANPLQSPEFKSELVNFVKTENEVTLSPEIRASGREKDVRELVQRVIQKDYKVMVLCGESGVGKSSLVKAGLMPLLKGKMIAETTILPVAMRVYSDWMGELGRRLKEALENPPNPPYQGGDLDSHFSEQGGDSEQETILGQLQQCEAQQWRVVFIFDQFEEFFFNHTTTAEQHRFFEFLGHCLKNLSLKVVFSLRKDYLHYLLDVPGMESISHDILSKEVLYPIRNFSPQEAKEIIERLTAHSSFQMEEGLIEQLVIDLTEDGKVRPIELQVVGAQLQEEDIRTLAQYREAGTKAELVQRYLNQVVKGCGEANEDVANLMLYLLTDDRGTRPLKTHTELVVELQDLRALARQLTIEAGQLDLVLEILVLSGLVVLVPEKPEERYQLLHDYLVRFIREQQEPKIQEVIAQLEQEREKGRQLERSLQQLHREIEVAEQTKQQLAHDNRKARRWVQMSSVAALWLFLVAGGAGLWSIQQLKKAAAVTQLERQGTSALRQFEYQQIEALLTAMKAGRGLQEWVKDGRPLDKYPAASPLLALNNILNRIHERNQLQHQRGVNSAQFSPDGERILTASFDGTARVWDSEGKELATLNGHQATMVRSAQFSPDGERIVTASDDGTAKVWRVESLEQLLERGCEWLEDYLTNNPDGQKQREEVCPVVAK
jgi:tetratricopeptide (TPR) repeat protein